jgi:DNA primase
VSLQENRGGHSANSRRIIDAAREAVSVIDFADRLVADNGGGWRKAGGEWVARCPLPDHEDRTPSFTVNREKNVWWCHGCARGGDVVRLAALAWGYHPRSRDEQAAAAHLLHEFGREIPPRPPTWFAKEKRQAKARRALRLARAQAARRRCYRLLLRDLDAMGDPEPSANEREILWQAAGRIAACLLADREQREQRTRSVPDAAPPGAA